MAEYFLTRPSIDLIIDYCDDLEADEKLIVYEFGENADLVLHIYKDEEFDREIDPDGFNLVDIYTFQNGNAVDDAAGIYVTDGELYRELNRIKRYENFGTL